MVKKIIQLLLSLGILALGVSIFIALSSTPPETKKEAIIQELPSVEVTTVEKISEPLKIKAQGEIIPPKRTTLSSQVTGKILSVSPKYERGEQFAEGEVIMTVEDIDYRTALINAQATKTQALAALEEARGNLKDAGVSLDLENAKSAQAKRDWEALGKGKTPSELLLRTPQIKAAKARIQAIEARINSSTASLEQADANIKQAERNLERTRIRAPYPCQIEEKLIDLGALVTLGTPLTTVYEMGSAEVRLPIALEDIPYIKIGGSVIATAQYGNTLKTWEGKITRSENRIDAKTRTSYLIASFQGEQAPPVGLFTDVALAGKDLTDVFPVPRIALRTQDTVIVITPENTITFRKVSVARTTENTAYLTEGLKNGERVCVTVLNTPIEGMKVSPVETTPLAE